ncbi:MAG TPA: substrate-binding domain-containing protein [Ignavibacteria bacterium]|nr:substrate-binding domain-containing protein [Ignavibacteria bacterium]
MRRNKFLHISFLFLIALGFSSCDFSQIKSKATTGTAIIGADDNLEPLVKAATDEFMRINQGSKIEAHYGPTNEIVAELINSQIRTAIVPRNFNPDERDILNQHKIEVDSYKVAVDGIAFIVNPKNPVRRLTSDEIKKIFTGELTLWTQIKSNVEGQDAEVKSAMKGNDDKIKLFIQRPHSVTYGYVKDTVLNGMDYAKTSTMCSTSAQMMQEIRNNVNAIGISNSSWLSVGKQDTLDSTVVPVRISRIYPNGFQADYIQFHQGLVYNGTYPYVRNVWLLTTEKDINVATGFITFLLSTAGQQIVLKYGLVPVTQPVRTIQLN